MIRTPEEILTEFTGYVAGKTVTIPKDWIYQLAEQYADQYIQMGIGNPSKLNADVFEVKKEMAEKLRDKGFSYRQIQKALGYKSVRSISYILKQKI